jgi:hypothetical protein
MNFGLNKPNAEPSNEQGSFDSAKLYLWVKALEGKVNNLLRETDLLKNDLIRKNNDIKKELKTYGEDLTQFRREQVKMNEKMDLMIKEIKQTAGIEEVMTLKKYIDLWNPLNFVTQRDLDRAIQNKIEELNIHTNKKPEVKEEKENNKKDERLW